MYSEGIPTAPTELEVGGEEGTDELSISNPTGLSAIVVKWWATDGETVSTVEFYSKITRSQPVWGAADDVHEDSLGDQHLWDAPWPGGIKVKVTAGGPITLVATPYTKA